MKKDRSKGRLVWLWGVVPLIAVIEVFVQWRIPNWEPSEDDWKQAARVIAAEKQPRDLVIVAPNWATQGRMFLGHLMTFRDIGRFDTSTYERVYEVSAGGARAAETMAFEPESESEHGKLKVSRYKLPPPAHVIYDFGRNVRRASAEGFKRKSARILIDHWFNPRLVIPVPLSREPMTLTYEDVPLDGVLRGWGIIDYRHARHNKGRPVTLAVSVDGKEVGREEIHNFGPLEPFEYPIGKNGTGTVKFTIRAKDHLRREFGFTADVRVESESDE